MHRISASAVFNIASNETNLPKQFALRNYDLTESLVLLSLSLSPSERTDGDSIKKTEPQVVRGQKCGFSRTISGLVKILQFPGGKILQRSRTAQVLGGGERGEEEKQEDLKARNASSSADGAAVLLRGACSSAVRQKAEQNLFRIKFESFASDSWY